MKVSNSMMIKHSLLMGWCAAFVLMPKVVLAHDQIPGHVPKGDVAIVGGTVHVVDGPVLASGTVLMRDGKIVEVGKKVKLSAKCRKIDATDKHVYPGLMESISNLGLVEINAVDVTVDTNELGSENANLKSWIAVNPDSELIPVARSNGVLLASIAPDRGLIRGQIGVIALDGWTYGDMLIKGPAGMMASWRGLDSREDDDAKRATERDKRLKEFDEFIDSAKRYAERRTADSGVALDVRYEDFLPVIRGEVPMVVDADSRRSIEAAVTFCVDRGIRVVIYGGYDAAECATLLKRHDVPVIVHATYRLPRRRHEPYDHPYTLPKRLSDAGIRFAIGGEGSGYPGGASNARNLPYHAAVAAAYGLSVEDALRSITLSPAEIMGVADRVGSLTAGKDATLFIADGDILITQTQVTDAFIGGAPVDLGDRHKSLYRKYQQKYRAADNKVR